MEKKKKTNKQCDVCSQNIHHSSFAALLRSNNHLLERGEKVRGEDCKLVLKSGLDSDNQLLTDDLLDRVALAAPIRKI